MEVAFDVLSRLTRHEPAALLMLGVYLSPIFVVFVVSGLTRMGFVSGRSYPPRMFTAEPVRRLIKDSAESVHAPPYIRVGRENGSADALLVV